MRAARLISLVLLLQQRGQLRAEEIARELEVSVRTVHRDLDALSEAGIPVYAERGPGGGVRLVEGYDTRLPGLSPGEAEALALSGVPGPAAELGLGSLLAAAQLKLLAAMPEPVRRSAGQARQRFHLDAPGWFGAAREHPHLPAIAGAVWGNRPLALRYRRGDGRSVRREALPLGLVLKAGDWYLVARVDTTERVYRVARIQEVELRDGRFARDAGFDLAQFWDTWSRAFEAGVPSYLVTVRVAPTHAEAFLRERRADRERRPELPAPVREADGFTRAVVDYGGAEWAEAGVLRWGPALEVVAPGELRDRLARTAAALDALYRGGG